jgi:hypothetical protein
MLGQQFLDERKIGSIIADIFIARFAIAYFT